MSKRELTSEEEQLEHPEDSDTGILGTVLQRYKAVIFPADDHSDIDAATLDHLMAETSAIRSSLVVKRPPVFRFSRLSWVAAAAGFLLLCGVTVLFWPESSSPELTIVNTISLDHKLFAMRGGGGDTNGRMDVEGTISLIHEIAVEQIGRSVPIVTITPGDLKDKLSHALGVGASAGRGYFLIVTATSEEGYIQLEIRDKETGASSGKTQFRETALKSETAKVIQQLLHEVRGIE